MTAEELRRLFEPWRARHMRPAWKPVFDGPGNTETLSRFGGRPTGSPGDEWPACAACKAPMSFFVQLDLSDLPEEFGFPQRRGVLQMFYCSTDDGMCETWAAFTGTQFIRVAPPTSNLLTPPPGVEPLAEKSVTGWSPFQDEPHPEEHETLGLSVDYDFKRNIVDVQCAEPFIEAKGVGLELEPQETISNSAPGDKLGGWPYWVQSAEYPYCPECQTQMELLLQLDSNDNLDYMFGDLGCGHITYCPEHANIFAFGWACG